MNKTLNSKGNVYIWLIIFIVVFIGVSTLVIDFGNLYNKTKKVKYAVNRAVKAASMQIEESNRLAEGQFKIDETNAKEAFYNVLSLNLNLNRSNLEPLSSSILYTKPVINELVIINNTPAKYYSHWIDYQFDITEPCVVASIKFKIQSTFFVKELQVNKLSSSQLTSIY